MIKFYLELEHIVEKLGPSHPLLLVLAPTSSFLDTGRQVRDEQK
jgi:hypothetical protein